MGNKAFALTGRLADCCLYPGRCPGLGASALSGRAGANLQNRACGGELTKQGVRGELTKQGVQGELAKLDKHLNIYL